MKHTVFDSSRSDIESIMQSQSHKLSFFGGSEPHKLSFVAGISDLLLDVATSFSQRQERLLYPKLHSSDINHRSLSTAQIQNSFGSEMSLEAASRPGDPNYKDGTMMESQKSKPEEQLAASAVAALASTQDKGLASSTPDEAVDVSTSSTSLVTRVTRESTPEPRDSSRTLRSYPYFLYQDFSTVADPDPLAPLTPPGRVPNFPAKMHSILSRQDLAHIACWNPHGRSWRILKPREFEQQVIPTYVSMGCSCKAIYSY